MSNFNYARLFSDIYRKQQEINGKRVDDRYKQYHKTLQINTLAGINNTVNEMYRRYNDKLTQEGRQRNIRDVDLNERTIYKRFRPMIYKRDSPEEYRNKWKDSYRSYSLSSVYNDNILNENIERKTIEPLFQHLLSRLNHRYKYKIIVECTFKDLNGNQLHLTFSSPHFITVDDSTDLYESFITALLALKNNIINSLPNSNLVFESFDKVYISSFRINELSGSSYIDYKGENGKSISSIINPHNNDKKCFYWAVAVGLILHRKEHVKDIQRISVIKNQLKELKINIDDSMLKDNYPVKVKNNEKLLSEFEKKNNISINIYVENDGENEIKDIDDETENEDDDETTEENPICANDNESKKGKHLGYHTHNNNHETINLLLISDKNTGNSHYIYLKKLFRNDDKYSRKYCMCNNCKRNFKFCDINFMY